MKKMAFILVSATTVSFSTLTLAEVSLPMGWYLEGNLGSSKISDVSYAAGTHLNTTGLGWNVNGGYKFIPYFAAEIGYTSYGNGNITLNSVKVGKDQVQSYDLAAKAIVPVQDTGAEIFAKLGAARAKSHVTVTNETVLAANGTTLNTGRYNSTNFYFGLGGDYSFMPNMAANIQWNRVAGKSKTGNLDLLSLGLTYLFD
ncbi:MAG: hypothetical protein K0R24_1813 [Gammaproteobacteria bacterium]|jgi:hypothetical protein|nr:hypothetical protein [Gammaproteobacteria bacterium]